MHLQTDKLSQFLNYGASVKPNVLYPALDSVKVKSTGDTIVLTKSNNNVFCEYSYNDKQPECEFLVNERMLSGFINTVQADLIDFDLNGSINMSAGSKKNNTRIQDPRFFPVTPEPINNDVFTITPDIISRADIAMRYVSRVAIKTAASFVGLDANGIFATNQSAVYHYACSAPQFFIDEDRLNALKILGQAMFNTSPSYDFFIGNNVAFAFVKTEIPPINYLPMLQMSGDDTFVVDRMELLNFCVRVEYSTKQEAPKATWRTRDTDGLYLIHEDADFEVVAVDSITVDANFDVPQFKFDIRILKEALMPLPYKKLAFTSIGPHYKITAPDEDSNYTGILAGLA